MSNPFRVFFPAVLILSAACSSFQTSGNPQRRLVLERKWVQSTLVKPDEGYSYAHQAAPLLTDDTVIQGNAHDGVVALNKEDGSEIWRLPVRGGVSSGFQLDGERLFFGASDGNFYSVNVNTGKVRWTFPTRMENLAAPVAADGLVIFLSGNNLLYALDAATGRQKWIYDRAAAAQDISIRGGARPAIYKGFVYQGFSDGFLVALKMKDGGLAWERQVNTNPKFKDLDGGPIVTEKYIYAGGYDQAVYCLSRVDGQVVWRYDEGTHTAVTLDQNRVYFSSSLGTVKALNAETGDLVWSKNLTGGIGTTPVTGKGLLILGQSRGPLLALDLRTGDYLGGYEPGWGTLTQIRFDEKHSEVFLMSAAGNVHVVKLGWLTGANTMPFVGQMQ